MRRSVVASGFCVLFIGCGDPPRPIPSAPAAHPWAAFPVGTWAERRVVIHGRESTERWELVSVEGGLVRLRWTSGGKTGEQTGPAVERPWTDRGEETLELAARRLRCLRQERDGERRWMCAEVPSWPVREENAEGTTVLVALNETVGGRACAVFDTKLTDGGTARRWKSVEVPGHVVKEVLTSDMTGTVELVRFGKP